MPKNEGAGRVSWFTLKLKSYLSRVRTSTVSHPTSRLTKRAKLRSSPKCKTSPYSPRNKGPCLLPHCEHEAASQGSSDTVVSLPPRGSDCAAFWSHRGTPEDRGHLHPLEDSQKQPALAAVRTSFSVTKRQGKKLTQRPSG